MPAETPVIHNRRALQLYHVDSRLEVGLALHGSEVKSIRSGNVQLADAWIDATEALELWLVGARIDEYFHANRLNHDPVQRRKLLARREEIQKLRKAAEGKGVTLIPLRLYFKGRWAKLEIGVCRGKADHDKRATITERDAKREMERVLKQRGGR